MRSDVKDKAEVDPEGDEPEEGAEEGKNKH
jgi:hypothetical protein